jgi:hypothetical protein
VDLERGTSVSVSRANVHGFDGTGVATVGQSIVGALLATDVAVAMVVRLVPGTSGYLLANTDPNGLSRYLGLWHVGDAIRWYFRTSGGARQSLRFNLTRSIDDGALHQVLFTVNASHAALAVDGVSYFHTLGSAVVPIGCPGGCRVVIGGRASETGSAFRMTGAVAMARVYRTAASLSAGSFPDPREWTFFETRNMYMALENDLGEFPASTISSCLDRCFLAPTCRSFDVGVVGTTREGRCFLSSQTLDTRPSAARASQLYNYYQRIE